LNCVGEWGTPERPRPGQGPLPSASTARVAKRAGITVGVEAVLVAMGLPGKRAVPLGAEGALGPRRQMRLGSSLAEGRKAGRDSRDPGEASVGASWERLGPLGPRQKTKHCEKRLLWKQSRKEEAGAWRRRGEAFPLERSPSIRNSGHD
jgi:hypothetical protein